LQKLAELIMEQKGSDPDEQAVQFINAHMGINVKEDALEGAGHILAEWISENRLARSRLRRLFVLRSQVRSKVIREKEESGSKYSDYFDFCQTARSCPSHRILAMMRGESEGILSLSFLPPESDCIAELENIFLKGTEKDSLFVRSSLIDSYRRLLAPSMERELRNALKRNADNKSISVFRDNIRDILMAPPLGNKRVLSIDPGFRTGCKLVCLDDQGQLLHSETIYPHPPRNDVTSASSRLLHLIDHYRIEAIAVGNGTGGRETLDFITSLEMKNIIVTMVNESGASIYSASDVAREELPDEDITVRGAVSIGRRLIDPLAELVKLEPRSIGVGQYQHDVDQKLLKQSLDDVVVECVNRVGVEINTASKHLLSYVSGLGPSLAENIVNYRKDQGPFRSRGDLSKVPRLGPKAFEQCAGFLRIFSSDNPLDNTAVHPHSYSIVEKMSRDLNSTVRDLLARKELRDRISPERYITDTIGMPTLSDIMAELEKPGRDPRNSFRLPSFQKELKKMEDLEEGMIVHGIITNITDFGAFVDIGVHHDGLVHISQISDRFIKHPSQFLSLGQQVMVKVTGIDLKRRRISLSMKDLDK
ncbi:MAG TPA: helix-hairpin-helix domain-containing protein, partial [Synergistales bacterium]|nr:helix-hairpin-helix domain-containing protein [Synergistales bacterium]